MTKSIPAHPAFCTTPKFHLLQAVPVKPPLIVPSSVNTTQQPSVRVTTYVASNDLTVVIEKEKVQAPLPILVALDLLLHIHTVVKSISLAPDNVPSLFVTAIAQSVASSPQPLFVPCSGYWKVSLPTVNAIAIKTS